MSLVVIGARVSVVAATACSRPALSWPVHALADGSVRVPRHYFPVCRGAGEGSQQMRSATCSRSPAATPRWTSTGRLESLAPLWAFGAPLGALGVRPFWPRGYLRGYRDRDGRGYPTFRVARDGSVDGRRLMIGLGVGKRGRGGARQAEEGNAQVMAVLWACNSFVFLLTRRFHVMAVILASLIRRRRWRRRGRKD